MCVCVTMLWFLITLVNTVLYVQLCGYSCVLVHIRGSHVCGFYGGPEGSLPIAFLFKRFLCLSDLFQ